jgi:Bacterial PH domain
MSSAAGQPSTSPPGDARRFRLPWLAYLAVGLLTLCVLPLALAGDPAASGAAAILGPRAALLLIPVLAAAFVARTATVVDEAGLCVRAVFGSRLLRWTDVRGLAVNGRSVYAVVSDGAVRLPCVHVSDLAAVSAASGRRLPELPEATPKPAPSRRRR